MFDSVTSLSLVCHTSANILLSPTTSRDVEGTDFHQDVNAERTVLSTGPDRARKPNLPATASSALSNVSLSCLASNYSIPISDPDEDALYCKECHVVSMIYEL